jgi:hypothetical protein
MRELTSGHMQWNFITKISNQGYMKHTHTYIPFLHDVIKNDGFYSLSDFQMLNMLMTITVFPVVTTFRDVECLPERPFHRSPQSTYSPPSKPKPRMRDKNIVNEFKLKRRSGSTSNSCISMKNKLKHEIIPRTTVNTRETIRSGR